MENIEVKLQNLENKVDAIYTSVEKTRKYFFWVTVITIALFVLPLIGLIFAIPSFIGNYTETLQSI